MASTVTITLLVTNTMDNSPIQGARVFINGSANFDPSQFSVATDVNGKAVFAVPLSPNAAQLSITADGFNSFSQTLTVSSTNPQAVQAQLTLVPQQVGIASFRFIPAVAGILFTLTDSNSNQVLNTVTTDGGIGTSVTPVPFGTYTLNATLPGYSDLNTTLNHQAQADPYTFTLVADADTNSTQQGSGNGNSSASLTSGAPTSSVTTVAPNQAEYIYPNSDYDKYFTTISARIYIGNLFIDECNTINYALQDNAIPVYGYASRYVDAYAQGRSLVQGQITLNFVTEGYLYTVLKEYSRFVSNNVSSGNTIGTPQTDIVSQTLGLLATRDSLIQQGQSNPLNTNAAVQANILNENAYALMQGMTPDQLMSLGAQRQQQLSTFTDVIGFDNAVYQDVLFDIRIELGNEAEGVKRVRYLEKCKLISNEQLFDQSGQPVLDSYGFIARRLR